MPREERVPLAEKTPLIQLPRSLLSHITANTHIGALCSVLCRNLGVRGDEMCPFLGAHGITQKKRPSTTNGPKRLAGKREANRSVGELDTPTLIDLSIMSQEAKRQPSIRGLPGITVPL